MSVKGDSCPIAEEINVGTNSDTAYFLSPSDVHELIEAVADVLKRNAPDWAAAENAESRSVALHAHARANSLRSAEQWTRRLAVEVVTVTREEEATRF